MSPQKPVSGHWPVVVSRPTFLSRWTATRYWMPSPPLSRTHLTPARLQQRTSPVDEEQDHEPNIQPAYPSRSTVPVGGGRAGAHRHGQLHRTKVVVVVITLVGSRSGAALAPASRFQGEQHDQRICSARHHLQLR